MHLNVQEAEKYCEHFEYLKPSQSLRFDSESCCKFCLAGKASLWLCLSVIEKPYRKIADQQFAEEMVENICSRIFNIFLDEESRRIKKFHSIFINVSTSQIWCIQCQHEIWDLDIEKNAKHKLKLDPFPLRLKILPALGQLTVSRRQLQNSEGHKKIGKGLVGIFGDKHNHAINSAIQFIAHSSFLRDVYLNLKIEENQKQFFDDLRILYEFRQLVLQMQAADFRAIRSDKISDLLYKDNPNLLGYERKDPFEHVLYFLGKLNEFTAFYEVETQFQSFGKDQWDNFYRKGHVVPHCPIYDSIESILSLNYYCPKCKKQAQIGHSIQFLKLSFPKKKRKAKQVQRQLAEHRVSSPVKTRRKSLMDIFFKEEQFPLTVPQLIIQLLKQPLHKEKSCASCNEPLKKSKIHFQKLPDILIIQLARMNKEGTIIDQTKVQFSTDPIDMGTFTSVKEEEKMFDFQSAVCMEKGCLFPVVCLGQHNKQLYSFRNQNVQLCKQKINPYLLCYRRRPSQAAQQKYTSIIDNQKQSKAHRTHSLPDFWLIQIKHGIEKPLSHQLVCKHDFLKPKVESKMIEQSFITRQLYEDLLSFYSGKLYESSICQECEEEIEQLSIRKKCEREAILCYDKIKGENIPHCMLPSGWVRKWSNYLYGKQSFSYMCKGYPFPPNIDNKVLLQGNKCKPNLLRNVDFKVVNIFLWRFLKEIYGGGPEIRYRWKQGKDALDEELLSEIKQKAAELKILYHSRTNDSPKKSLTSSLSFIERSTFLDSNNNESVYHPHQEMVEQIIDELD